MFLLACAQPALLSLEADPKDTAAPAAVSTVSLTVIDLLTHVTVTGFTVTGPTGAVTSADGSAVTVDLPAGEPATLLVQAPGYLDTYVPVVPERETWSLQVWQGSQTNPYLGTWQNALAYDFSAAIDDTDGQIAAVARTRDNLVYSNTYVNYQGVSFTLDGTYDELGKLDSAPDDDTETNTQTAYGWVSFVNTEPGEVSVSVEAPEGTSCYALGAAEPLDGPLVFEAVGGAVGWVVVDCQPTFPADCYDVLADDPAAGDGDHTLYVDHDGEQPWTATCVDMDTTEPAEYLTLPAGGERNFSTYQTTSWEGTDVTTLYDAVRVHPDRLVIEPGDQRFARSSGLAFHGGFRVTAMPYAVGGSCEGSSAQVGIDLRGTPFRVADRIVDMDGDTVPVSSIGGRVLSYSAAGYCDFVMPAPAVWNPMNGAASALNLAYAGY